MQRVLLAALLISLPALSAFGGELINDGFSANADAWQMNGSAVYSGADGWVRLTPATNGLAGTSIYKTPVAIGGEFTIQFDFFMGKPTDGCSPPGADGMTFFLMDAAAGTGFLGGGGGWMGISGAASTYKTLMIEMDNWNDGNPYDSGNENHIGVGYHPGGLRDYNPRSQFIIDPSNQQGLADNPFAADPAPDFEGLPATPTGWWRVTMDFKYGHFWLTLECIDATNAWGPNLVLEGSFVNFFPWPDLGNVIVGFSAGTGGCNDEQNVDNVKLTTPAAPLTGPKHFTCVGLPGGSGVQLDWQGTATSLKRNGTPIGGAAPTSPYTDVVPKGTYEYEIGGAGTSPVKCQIVYLSNAADPFSKLSIDENFDAGLDDTAWLLVSNWAGANPETNMLVGGRVLLTQAANDQVGSLVLRQPFFTEKFHIEFDFEIANSTNLPNSPADGFSFYFVPVGQPRLAPGWQGGMLGQGGQGFGPLLGLEIDNWWNGDAMDGVQWPAGTPNVGDNRSKDHVGVNYTTNPVGFYARDAMQNTTPNFIRWGVVADKFGPTFIKFHGTGVWHFSADIDTGAITIRLTDPQANTKEVLSTTVSGFTPFIGYLAFSASTGGRNQEHWIDNLILQVKSPVAPKNFRINVVDDDVSLSWTNQYQYTEMKLFRNGTEYRTLAWPANTFNDNNVPGGRYEYILKVKYATEEGQVGGTVEVLPLGVSPRLSAGGKINTWLTLGPYVTGTAGGDAPGYDRMAGDWLTDGTLFEDNIKPGGYQPKHGDDVPTDYQPPEGSGASLALMLDTDNNPQVNPDVVTPSWYLWQDDGVTYPLDGWLAFEDVYRRDNNQVMSYALIYIFNPLATAQDLFCGAGSDDSLYVRVNGEELFWHNEPRGSGGAIQNEACLHLEPGMNSVLTKTFEGGGGFNVNFQLQDENGAANHLELPFTVHTKASGEPIVTLAVTPAGSKVFNFAATASDPGGSVANYEWDFDLSDGLHRQATGASVSYTYAAEGRYVVTVVVTDNAGDKTLVHRVVEVRAPAIIDPLPATDVGFRNIAYRRLIQLQTDMVATWSVTTNPPGIGAAVDANGVLTLPAASATGTVQFTITATTGGGSDTATFSVNFNLTEFADDFTTDPLGNPLWVVDFPPAADPANITLAHAGGALELTQPATTPDYDIWCGFDRAPKFLRPVTGDFSFEVKVTMLTEDASRYRHPGIMVVLDSPNIPDGFMWGFIRGGVNMERVCNYDGMNAGDSTDVSGPPLTPPYDGWFRVDRVGPNYSFLYKMDEADPWTLYYTTTLNLEPTYVGPFYKSWGSTAQLAYDDVVMRPIGIGPQSLACSAADGTATLTWTEPAGATAVRVFRDVWYDGAGESQIGTPAPGTKTFSDTPTVANYAMVDYRVEVDYPGGTAGSSCTVGVAAKGWVAFQDGLAPSAAYEGAEDAHTILYRSGNNEWNTGANNSIEEGGWDTGTDYKHILIQFDLSSLPTTTQVYDAILSMHYWYDRQGSSAEHSVYAAPLLKAWNEGRGNGVDGENALCGEVSWKSAVRPTDLWEVPGQFGTTDVGAAVAEHLLQPLDGTGAARQYRATWQSTGLTNLVKQWVSNRASNHGLKLAPPTDGNLANAAATYALGGYNFVSSNYPTAGYRPFLAIQTAVSGVGVWMGNANGDNTVNIADAVTILGYLFGKPPKPAIPCFKAADTNDDNTLNVADAIDILTFLFGAQSNPSKPMTGPDGSSIGSAACRLYPASDIPAQIIGQPGCATPCTPTP